MWKLINCRQSQKTEISGNGENSLVKCFRQLIVTSVNIFRVLKVSFNRGNASCINDQLFANKV